MIHTVPLGKDSYDIVIERGCLQKAGALLNLERKVLVVTDSGVPAAYAETLAGQCRAGSILCVSEGEQTKCFATLQEILSRMLSLGFTRSDCVVAVGGGMVGDLAGFAAAIYMRGIDFYNIPTTVLSQVDSSIGGKTAIDLDGIKNIVGAFYQPKKVLIDCDTLKTLPPRQIASGLAEALKMSMTGDPALFGIFEAGDPLAEIDTVVAKSIAVKSAVVAADEKEQGLRRVLNFGHSIGHAVESFAGLHGLYHGECVALGMIPMCSQPVRARLLPILEKLNLPTAVSLDADAVIEAMGHDKKMSGDKLTAILVDEIGSFRMDAVSPDELKESLQLISKGAAQ